MKELIDKIQALIDLHGDTWLGLFTALIMARIVAAAFKLPAITPSEAAAYSSCVAAFAATNIGGPKQS
jgi:hypothetical protein